VYLRLRKEDRMKVFENMIPSRIFGTNKKVGGKMTVHGSGGYLRRPGFAPGPVHVGFMVDSVAMELVYV
jgi:hypothetical protein